MRNKRFVNLITSVERKYTPMVEAAITEQIDYFASKYAQGETVNKLPIKLLEEAIKGIYQTAGRINGKYVREQLTKATKNEADNRLKWMINEYYKQYLLSKVVQPITDTTKKQIAKVLEQANEQGWGIKKTVSALRASGSITKQRAMLIARTESMSAANAAAMLTAADLDIMVNKKWLSTNDIRTRRIPRDQYDHLHMNGREVGFTDPFIVPSTKTIDAMEYPGDKSGSAGNVCNCRCTVTFVPVKDALGNTVSMRNNLPAMGAGNIFVQIATAAASFLGTTELIDTLVGGLETDVFL